MSSVCDHMWIFFCDVLNLTYEQLGQAGERENIGYLLVVAVQYVFWLSASISQAILF